MSKKTTKYDYEDDAPAYEEPPEAAVEGSKPATPATPAANYPRADEPKPDLPLPEAVFPGPLMPDGPTAADEQRERSAEIEKGVEPYKDSIDSRPAVRSRHEGEP